MKKAMLVLTVVLILILILAPVTMANESYHYTVKHKVELQLDGDFVFNSTITTPAQGNVDIGLAGEGTAYLLSDLEIIESRIVSSNWFDLF